MTMDSWLVTLGSLLAQQGGAYEWHWSMHPMVWGWDWGIGMMITMLLFWGLVITGLVLVIRWLLEQGKHGYSVTALEILKQRYAKGEIEKEEFEAKKHELS